MAIHVEFDPRVSELTGGAAGIDVSGNTVQEALFQVSKAYPALRMFNCEGELRSILKVARNTAPAPLADPVQDGETLRLSVG